MSRLVKIEFSFLIVLIISFWGCERSEDTVKEPEIMVIMPSENDVFSFEDTIFIKTTIKHIKDIRQVSLSVTDAALKPVISGKSILTSGKEVSIDTFLVVNNKYIEDALNYLHFEIEDADNLFNHWTPINIIPLPTQFENLLIVSGIDEENNLYLIEDEEMISVASWDSDYLGGFVDSKFNQFYTSGYITDGLRCYSLQDHSLQWSVSVQPTGSIRYFNSFDALNGRISVGLWDGSINSYDQHGLKVFSSSKSQNGRFSKILNLNKYIAGFFSPFNGGTYQLMIFNYPAGNIYHSMLLEGRPIDLFPIDERTFLVISEVNGVNKAYHYKLEEKTLYFLHNVTSLTINRVTGDGRNIFLVSSDAILWYRPEINSTVQYLPITNPGSIKFEPEESVLYVSIGTEVFSYKLPALSPDKIYNIGEPVKDILLLYNK